MGKTSLLNRVLAYAAGQNYQIVRLNLRKADKAFLTDLNKFLRWFCLNASRQLNLESKIDGYWDEEIGSKVSCTGYFESYLLEQLNTNLVIALDEIDTVFPYPDLAEDFLALLREWHEEATIQESWRKLRLVIANSTEAYISLNIHQSPFNVGLPLRLPPFDRQQIQSLAQLHGLTLTVEETQSLTAMVGGHPYLIRLALYYLARQEVTLQKLLQDAPTHAGIYSDRLRRCLHNLQQQPELASALKQVVTAREPVQLASAYVYQLDSMGIVQLKGDRVTPSCELYRQYFNTNLV
jgi:AAA-like domain